jgi:ATP-dependent DNA helicase RecG
LGCTNKGVIGGLESFVAHWQSESLASGATSEELTRISTVVSAIEGYANLDPIERNRVLNEVLRGFAPPRAESRSPAGQPAPVMAVPAIAKSPTHTELAPNVTSTAEPQAARSSRRPSVERRPQHTAARPAREAKDTGRPVTVIAGIKEANAKKLLRLQIVTVDDLIHFFPRRYIDYSALKTIDQLFFGEEVTVIGTVLEVRMRETRRGIRIVEMVVSDDTGSVQANWFNNPYIQRQFRVGDQIAVSGRLGEYLGRLIFTQPTVEALKPEMLNTGRVVPMYRLTEGVTPGALRSLIKKTLDEYLPGMPDTLPPYIRQRTNLPNIETALRNIHFPDTLTNLERARRRLAFDEFLLVQLGVLRQRQRWQAVPAKPLPASDEAIAQLVGTLPFGLTAAQQRAISDISGDMGKPVAMSRLLQGDVGSGKTLVAAVAAQIAVANGKQAAMMAPTEILAEQHFRTFSRLFAPVGVQVRLLTGSVPKSDKAAIKTDIESGRARIIVGTHAVIQDDVRFNNLALVVVDEQHRFGVGQRAALRQKGTNPHMLVMTATPIPRTLSLTLYGDLDLSVLDEMPPGRQPIITHWRQPLERERTYTFVRSQVQAGRQAFIICPLVEESDKLEAKSAIEEHARLQRDIFPDLRLSLLHGRMKGNEKEEVMRSFLNHETDILVSTSVVEVGIDVPNATVMLVEGANRFGLSQLHQFRGRVGRGEYASYCFLLADSSSQEGEQRLSIIEQTLDGFRLAEEDLKLRGPGEFFGTRQSGLPDLKVANLGDVKVLEDARREAQEIFARDPMLVQYEHKLLGERVRAFWSSEGDLS